MEINLRRQTCHGIPSFFLALVVALQISCHNKKYKKYLSKRTQVQQKAPLRCYGQVAGKVSALKTMATVDLGESTIESLAPTNESKNNSSAAAKAAII